MWPVPSPPWLLTRKPRAMNDGQDRENQGCLLTDSGKWKLGPPPWMPAWKFLKTRKIGLLSNPSIGCRDAQTSRIIVTLFTVAQKRNQPGGDTSLVFCLENVCVHTCASLCICTCACNVSHVPFFPVACLLSWNWFVDFLPFLTLKSSHRNYILFFCLLPTISLVLPSQNWSTLLFSKCPLLSAYNKWFGLFLGQYMIAVRICSDSFLSLSSQT